MNGCFFLEGTDDNVRLWSIANGNISKSQLLLRQSATNTHTADITRVIFSPDGKRALTAAKDQTAILWELAGGVDNINSIAVLHHKAYVSDASFSANGKLILTSSGEPKLRVWSAATGELLALFNPKGEDIQAGFAPDDKSLVAIGENLARSRTSESPVESEPFVHSIQPTIWRFTPLAIDPRARRDLGMVLAARQLDHAGIEKVESSDDLLKSWQNQSDYRNFFPPPPPPAKLHLAMAEECEATKQWYAAAWHLTQCLLQSQDNAKRCKLLLRRANAYESAAANDAESLPQCIADHEAAIKLGHPSAKDYAALAEARLVYATKLATAGKEKRALLNGRQSLKTTKSRLKRIRTTLNSRSVPGRR